MNNRLTHNSQSAASEHPGNKVCPPYVTRPLEREYERAVRDSQAVAGMFAVEYQGNNEVIARLWTFIQETRRVTGKTDPELRHDRNFVTAKLDLVSELYRYADFHDAIEPLLDRQRTIRRRISRVQKQATRYSDN